MKGNSIIVSPHPRGRKIEGKLKVAAFPGQLVTFSADALDENGDPQFELVQPGAAGNFVNPLLVLLEDEQQGRDVTAQYAANQRAFTYLILPGEEVNVMVATAATHTFRQTLIVGNNTGRVQAGTGAEQLVPFTCLEAIASAPANSLIRVLRS